MNSTVPILDEDRMLLWDDPIADQSDFVRVAIANLYGGEIFPHHEEILGRDWFDLLQKNTGTKRSAENSLVYHGIQGIKKISGGTLRWADGADPSKYHHLTAGIIRNYLGIDRPECCEKLVSISIVGNTRKLEVITKLHEAAEASGFRQYLDAAKALSCGDITLSANYSYTTFSIKNNHADTSSDLDEFISSM